MIHTMIQVTIHVTILVIHDTHDTRDTCHDTGHDTHDTSHDTYHDTCCDTRDTHDDARTHALKNFIGVHLLEL